MAVCEHVLDAKIVVASLGVDGTKSGRIVVDAVARNTLKGDVLEPVPELSGVGPRQFFDGGQPALFRLEVLAAA